MTKFHGTREAFAAAITDMAKTDRKIMFISPDSLKAMRATDFAEEFPEAYIEVGIAEQNAVAVAAGLASCGQIPFVGTYAGFMTMRACEQMRTFVAYPKLNVKFIGINAGLNGGEREGVTHQFYEDLGILSSIPNFTIFTPADGAQTYHAVKRAAEIDGPVYIRAGSGREIDIYNKEDPFNPDGVTVLKDYGTDTLILASGFILNKVLEAADLLYKENIKVTVGDVNILNGENNTKILNLMAMTNKIVTVEDHNINGGLGSFISKLACENRPVNVKRIGLNSFGESGPANDLIDYYGFSPENIAKTVIENLKL
ncbi:MAG: transketolase C-terminal domain-containing protein [Herbinix sp.]|nr:transketolase C-terminal domain-containing protein [Herbinix sp.]